MVSKPAAGAVPVGRGMNVAPWAANPIVCASMIDIDCAGYRRLLTAAISAALMTGKYSCASAVDGVLPQKIINSSGCTVPLGVGLICTGWVMRLDSASPGFGPSIQAILRCASLSEVAEVAFGTTGAPS